VPSQFLDKHFIDEVVEDLNDLFAFVSEFLGLFLQKVSSEIYQKHLEAKHAELNNQIVDVFQEHYNYQDKCSVLRVSKGSKVNFFRFINLNIDKLLASVDKLEYLSVLTPLELIKHSRIEDFKQAYARPRMIIFTTYAGGSPRHLIELRG
jgi:hypothetical protein